jgi:hypothetical protein
VLSLFLGKRCVGHAAGFQRRWGLLSGESGSERMFGFYFTLFGASARSVYLYRFRQHESSERADARVGIHVWRSDYFNELQVETFRLR